MQTALSNLLRNQFGFSVEDAQNHADIIINAFDLEHKIVFWNKSAEIYFNTSREAAMGKRLEDIVTYVKGNEKTRLLDRALSGRPMYVANARYDKRPATYEQWVMPVKKEGKTVAALNIVKTILK